MPTPNTLKKFIVRDNDGFPYLPTLADTEQESKENMVALLPIKDWGYFEKKGHRVVRVEEVLD